MGRKELQLKPCPFCGGEATLGRDECGYFIIGCENSDCFAYINRMDGSPSFFLGENAIDQWNYRVPDDEQDHCVSMS